MLGAGVLYLGVIAARPRRLAETNLLAPLFEAGVKGHIVALLSRLPHLVVLFLGTWLPFHFFGVTICHFCWRCPALDLSTGVTGTP